MPSPDPTWTDVWQTLFLGLQLGVLIAAAIFGWRQLREATELREAQTRPFVVIDLSPAARRPFFDLVVNNLGATMARDVRFNFDPAPETTISEASLGRLKMFRDGISTLPPGKEIRALFDNGPARFEAQLPDVYAVTIEYRGPSGEPYLDVIDLDFGLFWNRMNVHVNDLHDVHKELKAIHGEMRGIREFIASR